VYVTQAIQAIKYDGTNSEVLVAALNAILAIWSVDSEVDGVLTIRGTDHSLEIPAGSWVVYQGLKVTIFETDADFGAAYVEITPAGGS
jgi:hypothetical protein